MTDDRVTAFLHWLTEDGRVLLKYEARGGEPVALWLGDREVRRADLARVARGWAGRGELTEEAADALAGQVVSRVPAYSEAVGEG